MEYQIENQSGVVTVLFQGDITFSENLIFRQMLTDIENLQVADCVFDLASVGMVDSAGLGLFLIAREKAEASGWKLHVRGARGNVSSMLELTKLSEILED